MNVTTRYKDLRKDHLQKLCSAGWTDKQIADFFGIHQRTLYRWRNRYPDLGVQMDAWKEEADRRVERSCYEAAIGYDHPHEEIHIIKDKVVRVQTTKHYPPNSTAFIFWLTNRKHGDWKRTRQEEGADPLSVKVLTMIKNNDGGNGKIKSGDNGGAAEVSTAVTVERKMKIV